LSGRQVCVPDEAALGIHLGWQFAVVSELAGADAPPRLTVAHTGRRHL
jgi:hypothetical protein